MGKETIEADGIPEAGQPVVFGEQHGEAQQWVTVAQQAPAGEEALLERLGRLEDLLARQNMQSEKALRWRQAQTMLLGFFVLVFVCVTLFVGIKVSAFAKDVGEVVHQISETAEDISGQFDDIVDGFSKFSGLMDEETFGEMRRAMEAFNENLGDVDFESMGDSIRTLQKVAEQLQWLADIF